MTTIVLADDHNVIRAGLRSLLEANRNFRVIGEASDGLEVAQMVESLRPDVLVLDLMLPHLNGIEITRDVVKRSPRTAVVILSMYGTENYVHEALKAGAKAYVLKESTSEDLVRAIKDAIAGRLYLSSPLSEQAIRAYIQMTSESSLDPYDALSPREREVFQMAAQGHHNTDIAELLHISRRTVEVHRANMMAKLGLNNQTDLVHYAIKRGNIPTSK
jgi:two-component system response regulator NreC